MYDIILITDVNVNNIKLVTNSLRQKKKTQTGYMF